MSNVPLKELPELARNVHAALGLLPPKPTAAVVFLQGELGAGKTTFVQALAKEYGVAATVQSPTYVLMKKYELGDERLRGGAKRRFKRLIHLDLYRLVPEELQTLKPETFFNDPEALVLIEWPERAEGVLPKPDMTIKFSSENVGENERNIEVH